MEYITRYKTLIIVVLTVISLGTTTTFLLNSFNPDSLAPYINQQSNGSIAESNRLSLMSQHLSNIPEEVLNQLNLEELNLSKNNIVDVQGNIGLLVNLKILNLSNNQITNIPSEIGQLSSLQTLDLSNNKLTSLPSNISNLTNLKTLNISGNKFSQTELVYITNELPATVNIIR